VAPRQASGAPIRLEAQHSAADSYPPGVLDGINGLAGSEAQHPTTDAHPTRVLDCVRVAAQLPLRADVCEAVRKAA